MRRTSMVVATLVLIAVPAAAQPVQPGAGTPPPAGEAGAQPAAEPELELPPPPPSPTPPPPPVGQELAAEPALDTASQGAAEGFALQATLATGLASISTLFSSGMLVGYRSDRLLIGARVGLDVLSISPDSSETETITLFSVSPTLEYYLWKSRDGRVALDLLGSIGLGWAGISSENRAVMPPSSSDSSALFLPLAVGIGMDCFIHRNFAFGLEGGYQGAVLLSSQTNGRSGELSLSLHGLYGAFRMTAVVGD